MYLTFHRINYTRNLLNLYFVMKINIIMILNNQIKDTYSFSTTKFFLNEFNIIFAKAISFLSFRFTVSLDLVSNFPSDFFPAEILITGTDDPKNVI